MPLPDTAVAHSSFEAIGTRWLLRTESPLPPEVLSAVHERIEAFSLAYSRFRSDSLVSRLARDGGEVHFPDDLPPLLEVYRALERATGGAVNPLVGASLEQLGYDRDYRLTPSGPPLAAEALTILEVEGSLVRSPRPVLLDVGAAGKGYLVDLVADLIASRVEGAVTVDASGDLVHRSDRPLRAALEHPYDPTRAVGVVELHGGALCGSAVTRRSWGDGLHHVLDATTGIPVDSVVATWALHADALHADGIATALFFVDAASLHESTGWDFEAVRMFSDGRIEATGGLPGEVFVR